VLKISLRKERHLSDAQAALSRWGRADISSAAPVTGGGHGPACAGEIPEVRKKRIKGLGVTLRAGQLPPARGSLSAPRRSPPSASARLGARTTFPSLPRAAAASPRSSGRAGERPGPAGQDGGGGAEPRGEPGGLLSGHRRYPGAPLQRDAGLRLPEGWDAEQGDPGGPREGLCGRLPGEPALRQPRPGVSSRPCGDFPPRRWAAGPPAPGGGTGGRGRGLPGSPGPGPLQAPGGAVSTRGESFRRINGKRLRFIPSNTERVPPPRCFVPESPEG